LPVPDSPLMCTGAWLRETLAMVSRSPTMALDLPSRRPASSGWAVRRVLSSSAWRTRPRSTLMSTGLLTKSKAPAFSASTAASTLP
jgi:hypothetical protein